MQSNFGKINKDTPLWSSALSKPCPPKTHTQGVAQLFISPPIYINRNMYYYALTHRPFEESVCAPKWGAVIKRPALVHSASFCNNGGLIQKQNPKGWDANMKLEQGWTDSSSDTDEEVYAPPNYWAMKNTKPINQRCSFLYGDDLENAK